MGGSAKCTSPSLCVAGRTRGGGFVRDWVHYKWKRVAVRPAWAAGLGTRVNVSMCRGGTDVCGMAPCEAMLKIRARQTLALQMLRLCFKISQARQRGRWAGGGSRGSRCPGDAHLRSLPATRFLLGGFKMGHREFIELFWGEVGLALPFLKLPANWGCGKVGLVRKFQHPHGLGACCWGSLL